MGKTSTRTAEKRANKLKTGKTYPRLDMYHGRWLDMEWVSKQKKADKEAAAAEARRD